MAVDLQALLAPIAGDSPTGKDIRYHALTDQIKEARRREDDVIQGVWKREVKTADYPTVVKLATQALTKQGKDLQIAAWLTEALTATDGFAGLKQGLELTRGLLEQYWDGVYPEIDEDGDLEMRATPLRWIGRQIEPIVRAVPFTQSGFGLIQYTESKTVPSEAETKSNTTKAPLRQEAIAEGKTTPEEFDQAVNATPIEFLASVKAEIEDLNSFLADLGAFCDEKFGDASPEFGPMKKALEEIGQTVHVLHVQRTSQAKPAAPPKSAAASAPPPPAASGDMGGALTFSAADLGITLDDIEAEPQWDAEPEPEPEPEPELPTLVENFTLTVAPDPFPPPVPTLSTAPPPPAYQTYSAPARTLNSREAAIEQIVQAAHFLRREDASSTVPYLVLRALRWGELRDDGDEPDPLTLAPPETAQRVQLKRLCLEGEPEEILEASETSMGNECGRAWLDVHRVTIQTLDQLNFHRPARAIRQQLASLLAEYPDLPESTLADDTPAANRDTRTWLKEEGIPGNAPRPHPLPAEAPPDAYDLALAAARNGRMEEAVGIMSREIAQENSGRGRFLGKVQLAEICVGTGHDSVAFPILEDLAAEIESRSLEGWESAETITQPLALLYACIDRITKDESRKAALYARICRLDPLRGLSLRRN